MPSRLNKTDKISEIIAIILLLTQALYSFYMLRTLPHEVAIHFNGNGQADGWGNKNNLWLPVGLSIFMYGLFTFISFRPGLFKWRMTNNNLNEQHRLTSKMSRTVKSFIILSFFALTVFMFKTAQGQWLEQMPFLILIIFALLLPPCFYYAVKIVKVQ